MINRRRIRLRIRRAIYANRILAFIWRRLMFRTTIIAITGSVGKTTTKDLLAAALSSVDATSSTWNNDNNQVGVCSTVLSIRPWHKYAIIELGTSGPGQIAKASRLVKPHIGIILSVARTHTRNYQSLDETAVEKRALVERLPKDGIAILNDDDERVRNMANGLACRIVRYGVTDKCAIRGSKISSSWPDRFSMQVDLKDTKLNVKTKLVGTHWASSVLAVLATVDVLGIDAGPVLAAISEVRPFMARMQPMQLPCGAIVIRDEGNGSPDTLEAMLKVLVEAKAQRRILVITDLTDSPDKPKKRQKALGKFAAQYTDMALFLSDHGHHAVKAALTNGMSAEQCHHLMDYQAAAELLKSNLKRGDLVFLKGRGLDHLSRIAFAQFGELGCWKHTCPHRYACDVCQQLNPEFDLALLRTPIEMPGAGASNWT